MAGPAGSSGRHCTFNLVMLRFYLYLV